MFTYRNKLRNLTNCLFFPDKKLYYIIHFFVRRSHEVTLATSDITTGFFTVSVFTDIKIETFRMLLILYTTSQEVVTFCVHSLINVVTFSS